MKIFIIAGEASGDVLGGKLMRSLQAAQHESDLTFSGIGGANMQGAGLNSLIPLEELSLMGIWEILPRLPNLYRIYKGTLEEIEAFQPDIIITIDAPDFSFRIGAAVRKNGNIHAKIFHYVAPTVWAWRPGRAGKIAKFLDGIVCLLPFEPPYFIKEKLPAAYSGHPVIEERAMIDAAPTQAFRAKHAIPPEARTVGLFFGSRKSELERHAQTLIDGVNYLAGEIEGLHVIVPTLQSLEYDVLEALKALDCPFSLTTDPGDKWAAFKACDTAVAVSGTVGLELAYAGVPHMIGYRMSAVTYHIAKRLIRVKHAHLANIILKEEVVPEHLQNDFTYENVFHSLYQLLQDKELRAQQAEDFTKLRELMAIKGGEAPSDRAARFVLSGT